MMRNLIQADLRFILNGDRSQNGGEACQDQSSVLHDTDNTLRRTRQKLRLLLELDPIQLQQINPQNALHDLAPTHSKYENCCRCRYDMKRRFTYGLQYGRHQRIPRVQTDAPLTLIQEFWHRLGDHHSLLR